VATHLIQSKLAPWFRVWRKGVSGCCVVEGHRKMRSYQLDLGRSRTSGNVTSSELGHTVSRNGPAGAFTITESEHRYLEGGIERRSCLVLIGGVQLIPSCIISRV
jgi:hypothetical protein